VEKKCKDKKGFFVEENAEWKINKKDGFPFSRE